VSLRDSLQVELDRHRSSRGIVPAIVRCHKCGSIGQGAPPKISVRAMLIALRRFGVTSEAEAKQKEKEWERLRKQNALDRFGRPSMDQSGEISTECQAVQLRLALAKRLMCLVLS